MAIYSLSTKPISRSSGRSAVAAAAYRSGTRLVDEHFGVIHDYTRRRGVEHVEIIAAPGVELTRDRLWNQAEGAERRRDARVAREHLIALPHELDAGQRLDLARQYAQALVERYGVAVDLAIHAPDLEGDQRNHHAHLLVTTRQVGPDGFGAKANIEWSDKRRRSMELGSGADEIKQLRQRWETLANNALEAAHTEARIDHRSLKSIGSDRIPQIHVGPMGTDQIRRGTPESSDRAQLNLRIQRGNTIMGKIRQLTTPRRPEPDQQAQANLAASEAGFEVFKLTTRVRELATERESLRQRIQQLRGKLASAQEERNNHRGIFKRRRRHEIEQRIDELDTELLNASEKFHRIDDEYRPALEGLEKARERSRNAAQAVESLEPARESAQTLKTPQTPSQEPQAPQSKWRGPEM